MTIFNIVLVLKKVNSTFLPNDKIFLIILTIFELFTYRNERNENISIKNQVLYFFYLINMLIIHIILYLCISDFMVFEFEYIILSTYFVICL